MKVDILEIIPATRTIQEAMHKQISAERVRRANVITADGFRERMKTEAEGECAASIARSKGDQQVTVIKAKGEADAVLMRANAEAEALRIVAAGTKILSSSASVVVVVWFVSRALFRHTPIALGEVDIDVASYIVALKYVVALGELAESATTRTLYLPFEHDVVGALGTIINAH